MITAFNGERLKMARVYRGLTVAELAEKADCLRQTVSMYESGKTKPLDNATVMRLADVLDFPVKFFMENTVPVVTGSTYFRALLTTNKKYRAEQTQKMEFLAHIYAFLQEFVEFPRLQVPDCSGCTPEEAAAKVRESWKLGRGPIDNLIHIVEQHGILVTSFATSTDDIDAFSQKVDVGGKDVYLIGYSNNKTSAARIHFDIAHELGHICLHEWSEDVESFDKKEFKQREDEANRFASAFLLPEGAFRADASIAPLSISYYKELKERWKVSIQAMCRRAYTLGLTSMDEYQFTMRNLQRRGMRKEEPLDDTLRTSSPALLKTAVSMLLEEDVFTAKEFMDEFSYSYGLSLAATEIEYLLDLPKGTLSVPHIIEFSSLQLKARRSNN